MLKNVIFDMDGVLANSEHAITLAGCEALNSLGIPAKYEDFKQFTGMGEDRFIGGVAELHGFTFTQDMKNLAYDIYIEKALERIGIFDWSKPLTEGLVESGYKIALASAADYIKVRCNINTIGISEKLFTAIVTGSDVKNKKPDPEIFLAAAEKAGFTPSETIVFEDAVAGVMAAKSAGMKCCAVTTSFEPEALFNAGADYVLRDLSLPNVLNLLKSEADKINMN